MRYEHIELDLSTATCYALLDAVAVKLPPDDRPRDTLVYEELLNLANELRARLQRRDVDVQCPKNQVSIEWLDV